MPGRPLQKLARDAALAPSTVTAISTGQLDPRRPRRQGTRRSSDLSRTRLHPLILAEVKHRTGHLEHYQISVMSPLEVLIH
jgi:hypothetical protein